MNHSGRREDRGSVGPIIWVPGVDFDSMPGTDKRMVLTLASAREVIWIDPPARGRWRGWLSRRPPAVTVSGDGRLTRVRVPSTRGTHRWPVRWFSAALMQWTILRSLPHGRKPAAIVLANPAWRFPRLPRVPRVLYVTDDWLAGASLMGFSRRWLQRVLTANTRRADAVAAITTPLVEQLRGLGLRQSSPVAIIPNGAPNVERVPVERIPVAGVVGQLNERLDLTCLEAVADAGVPLRLIGPRVDRDPAFGQRLQRLLERPGVEWTGALDAAALAEQLSTIAVGLTPYADSEFNRASFPLKSLEYLAAGVPVVSTDIAASRWLDYEEVAVARSPEQFAAATKKLIEAKQQEDATREAERIAFAAGHSWSSRAAALTTLIEQAQNTMERMDQR